MIRTDGTNTRRASLTMNWERPFVGVLGDLWKITLHGDAAAYDASDFNEQPNYGPVRQCRYRPRPAADGGGFPLAVRARRRCLGHPDDRADRPARRRAADRQQPDDDNYPNEDSLDFEFTDANLFGFNRFTGIDRLDGGDRANVACTAPGISAARRSTG